MNVELIHDDQKRLIALFDIVRAYTLAGGGDGIGYVITEKFREFADLFEKYEQTADALGPHFIQKHSDDNGISFFNKQEGLIFTSPESLPLDGVAEIIVRVYW